MPPEEKTLEDTRPDFLKELDDFNTAPEFGMLGILAEQNGQEKEVEDKAPAREEKKSEPEIDYSKAYEPLNTSIQELSYQQGSRLEALERSLHELRNGLTTAQAQHTQPQTPPNYDPDQPVTMQQYMEQVNRLRQVEHNLQRGHEQFALDTSRLNAHLALSEYKRARPDFKMSSQELDRAFHAGVARNKNEVLNANWVALFDQLYNQTVLPERTAELEKLQKRVQELEQEAKSFKKAPAQTTQLSPATRTTSRTIQSPANAGDLDVANLKSFRRQGHWKEYSRDIKKHHGIA